VAVLAGCYDVGLYTEQLEYESKCCKIGIMFTAVKGAVLP